MKHFVYVTQKCVKYWSLWYKAALNSLTKPPIEKRIALFDSTSQNESNKPTLSKTCYPICESCRKYPPLEKSGMVSEDLEDLQKFTLRCQTLTNNYLISLSVLTGLKVGLFDTLSKFTNEDESKTSQEIAHVASLKERYVREWLGTMVVGDIVDCDPSGTKFWLSKERARILEKEFEVNSFLKFGWEFSKIADPLASCFKIDGPRGLSYDNYTGFHRLMATDSNFFWQTKLIPDIIPKVPGLERKLEEGVTCLDIGCGSGVPSRLMAQKYTKSDFWGIDFEEKCIALARNDSVGLPNVHFEVMDANKLKSEWKNSFDLVTAFITIHDLAYPDKVLVGIFKLLKSGGLLVVYETKSSGNCYIDKKSPFQVFLYTLSLFHCMPVSLYHEGSMGLGTVYGVEKLKQLIAEAGFVIEDIIEFRKELLLYVCIKP